MMQSINPLPAFDDVLEARDRLAGKAVRTPLITSPQLNENLGGTVLIKPECLQRTGSFKFRGAWNRISRLSRETAPAGVVAYSSGNHAQGVAAAAGLVGIPAVIVMPADTPEIKKANTRALGAEIVPYDRQTQSREEIGAAIAADRGAILVPPYDDRHIIAGQGTVGLEIAEDLNAMGLKPDTVLVGASGGGLAAGIALAIEARAPQAEIWSVEPEGFDDHARSLLAGERCGNKKRSGSICDALMSPMPGEITFAINRDRLAGGLVVSDEEVRRAMAWAFRELKIVVEPGGAVSLAAVLAGKVDVAGKVVCVVATGGNVDPALAAEVLRRH